ncbi:MAG: DMT family transporter [Clostridia bacterium]|nr:DMT family transporter [Clostridia bacterium]
MTWIFLILLYGIFKGFREALKKKSMETHSVMEVLFFYTLFAFLMIIPFSHNVFAISWRAHLLILFKSTIIFIAWICALNSIKRLPLSLYSIVDMSRMLFSIFFGVIFLREALGVFEIIGMALVITGITLVNLKKECKNGTEEKPTKLIMLLVLTSCILNSISALLDKLILAKDGCVLLGGEILDSSQLQFWYMLYLTSLYALYIIIKREKINFKKCVTSPSIWVMSVLFIVADRALFIANADPESKLTVMTLIKQSSVLVSILLGKIIYKEKHIIYRTLCAILIICGIVISVL